MIDGLRPYPETKPSELPWLGDVPAHWDVGTFGRFLDRIEQGWSPVAAEGELAADQWAVLTLSAVRRGSFISTALKPVSPHADIPKQLELRNGDLLLTRSNTRDRVGDVCVVNNVRPRTFMSDLIYRLGLKEAAMLPAFAMYQMLSNYGRWQIERDARGSSDSMPKIAQRHIKGWAVLAPPLDEQRLIVRFLGWHGARTAKLIRAKKRIIALLGEEKQAIIHRAVTRGLDLNAKLKPSGIPLLGDVPEGWKVKRLRNLADMRVSNVDKKSFDGEQPVRLCNYVDVYKNDTIHADIPFMQATASQAEIERFRLRIDDVVITKDSEDWRDIGVPALVRTEADDLVCAYHLALLRPGQETDGAFLFWQLLAPHVRRQFAIAANGVTRYGLSHGSIKETVLLAPDLAEQHAIAAYLNTATSGIRQAEADIQREITLVQEFRACLIADVVTGKFDVRAVAAALPEATDLEAVEEPAEDDDLDETAETEDEEVAA